MSFVYAFCEPVLSADVNRISSIKCPSAYFKFQLRRWALIGRRTLNRGGWLLVFPLNELDNNLVVPGKFTAFTKREAIGKTLKEEITHLSAGRGAYLIFWSWVFALIRKRALI